MVLLLRRILKEMPRRDIREYASNFFARPREELEEEMLQYIEARVR